MRLAAELLLALTVAGAATALAQEPAAPALAASPGSEFVWSPDGSTLLALEHGADDRLIAVRAFDGASGAPRWELAGERLAEVNAIATADTPLACVPSPDGTLALLGRGGRWWLWRSADAAFAAVSELADAASPRFSPDGRQIAFTRAGDLWAFAPGEQRLRRLTADGESPRDGEVPPAVQARRSGLEQAGFDWATDSHRLAFYRWDASGAIRLAVVDLVDLEARELELEVDGPGIAVGWVWRFDARAVGVLWLPRSEERLDLRLCHPERLYCRPLASRSWSAEREILDDFRFLEDGFLWGSASPGGALIAFYDTVGRERRTVVPSGGRVDIVALLEATREIAVAAELPEEPGFVRLQLIEIANGTASEIASAPGIPQVLVSAEQRAWVRPRKDAQGLFDGYVLERLDGTQLRRFD